MGIFFLVVGLFVVAILFSQLTWSSKRRERRSVEGHEHAMDVLRMLSEHRTGSPAPAGIEEDDLTSPSIPAAMASPAAMTDGGSAPPTADKGTTKPSFVFLAADAAAPPLQGELGSPPAIDEVLRQRDSRSRAFLSVFSRTLGEPRAGIAVGVGTIVVLATVAVILTGALSSSPSRNQQVRQVTSPPVTDRAPVPPPTIPTPVSSEPTPPASAPVAAPVTTIISPAVRMPRSFSSSITAPSEPPRSTIPTTTVAPPPPPPPTVPPATTATSISQPPTATTRPTTTTTTTTSTTSTTSTTLKH